MAFFGPAGDKNVPYVNLDMAASAQLRPEALAAMSAYDAAPFAGANPNSLHSLGRAAAAALERARRQIALSLGARVRPSEVVLTGGGTESNQLAVVGVAEGVRARHPRRRRVIISAIEHDSVLDYAPELRRRGFAVDVVGASRAGTVEPEALQELLADDVALVSVQLANNETGAVQPVGALAQAAHAAGALFHTDAIQAYLHLPFDANDLGVDALSIAAHKVGGPVGVGALYLKARTPLAPQLFGGGQEAGLRAGTQDVRGVCALAAVAEALRPHLAESCRALRGRSDALYHRLLAVDAITPTLPDPFAAERLPGVVSVLVRGWESEELVLKLDAAGFAVSAGSACSSGSLDPSHVLTAMGVSRDQAAGALRISFDERVDPADLERFADALACLAESR